MIAFRFVGSLSSPGLGGPASSMYMPSLWGVCVGEIEMNTILL